MQPKHTFYRIINMVILPVSAFIAIQVILFLVVALSSPALLLFDFVMACVPLYAFTANYFYNKSIRKGEQCKASFKDWIKVNAIVSLIFSAFAIFIGLALLAMLNDPKIFDQAWKQLPPNANTEITPSQFRNSARMFCYVFLPFSILLIIHIIITFTLLSKYKNRFGPLSNDPE